jgi:hypothetical protein
VVVAPIVLLVDLVRVTVILVVVDLVRVTVILVVVVLIVLLVDLDCVTVICGHVTILFHGNGFLRQRVILMVHMTTHRHNTGIKVTTVTVTTATDRQVTAILVLTINMTVNLPIPEALSVPSVQISSTVSNMVLATHRRARLHLSISLPNLQHIHRLWQIVALPRS